MRQPLPVRFPLQRVERKRIREIRAAGKSTYWCPKADKNLTSSALVGGREYPAFSQNAQTRQKLNLFHMLISYAARLKKRAVKTGISCKKINRCNQQEPGSTVATGLVEGTG